MSSLYDTCVRVACGFLLGTTAGSCVSDWRHSKDEPPVTPVRVTPQEPQYEVGQVLAVRFGYHRSRYTVEQICEGGIVLRGADGMEVLYTRKELAEREPFVVKGAGHE
jgi:hypothetical protein